MRTITETKTVYKFDELSDGAKEKARDWYREGGFDYDWWEFIYEDATRLGKLMGWNIKKIYFSGFSSQGDGACFDGSWYSSDVKNGEVAKEAPRDTELGMIATEFERLSKLGLSCTVKQSGHYQHEGCTSFDINVPDEIENHGGVENIPLESLENELKEVSRDFMRWIYKRLESEYDYMNSDEQIDENIRANEYEFLENGNVA